ncbi:MAG: hypothetical protein JST22_00635 [Bacteroidetes bacterium]|nr:hypothetical protein [Bacteroidota bacterium]
MTIVTSRPPFFVAIIALVFFLALASSARAQITATNNTGCTILLTLVDGSGALSGPYTVPSGSLGTILPTPAGYAPVGVEDQNGRTRSFTGGSPGCTPCIPLPATGGPEFCCGKVCFDSGTNSLTISSCSPCQ